MTLIVERGEEGNDVSIIRVNFAACSSDAVLGVECSTMSDVRQLFKGSEREIATHIPPVTKPARLPPPLLPLLLLVVGSGSLEEVVVWVVCAVVCSSVEVWVEVGGGVSRALAGVLVVLWLVVVEEEEAVDEVLTLQRLLLSARFLRGATGTTSRSTTAARARPAWLTRAMWPELKAAAERASERRTMHLLMEGIVI